MALSKGRLLASGFAIAGLAGAVALGYTAPYLGRTLLSNGAALSTLGRSAPAETGPVRVAARQKDGVQVDAPGMHPGTQVETGRNVRVAAPYTNVSVDKDSGKVRVKAPHTDVRVDPDAGRVRVRAPYVNLDIRW